MLINQINLSGKIVEIEKEPKGINVVIEQQAFGKFPTRFNIFIGNKLTDSLKKLNLIEGDEIVVLGATTYEKDGVLKSKITEAGQIQKYTPPSLNLGEKDAEEFFKEK